VRGGYCTVGAINKATTGGATMAFRPRAKQAIHALASTLGYVGGPVDLRESLYDFNDSPYTEKADIVALFQVTIDRLSA
jgi:hypothetical protein